MYSDSLNANCRRDNAATSGQNDLRSNQSQIRKTHYDKEVVH
jgi:hypothetical protein